MRLYDQPVAYVGIDVNPSIELGLNRFGIVVETTAINDDGRVLLESVALEGRSYDEALNALADNAMSSRLSRKKAPSWKSASCRATSVWPNKCALKAMRA